MRQLSKEEKQLNRNAIIRILKDNENALYVLDLENLKLDRGHRLIYEANIEQ